MSFQGIVGQERALLILQQALVSQRLAHAYLFYGPAGVGKKSTALQFVKALYCVSPPPQACDHCLSCRKITAGNHPDVNLITPEATTIKIEQVRALQRQLSYKPYENQRTTVIVDGCEYLTPPAANALLKTLEEPPTGTLLLLLTGNKAALPLTIVSRCQLVPFQPLAPSHLQAILIRQGVDTETAQVAASLIEGRLDRFYQGDFAQRLATRRQTCDILRDMARHQGTTWFLQARQLAGKRDQCEELLHWFALFLRDLTVLKVAGETPLFNHDLRPTLSALADRLPLDGLLEMFTRLQHLRLYLSANANPQLVFEHFLVHLQQALARS